MEHTPRSSGRTPALEPVRFDDFLIPVRFETAPEFDDPATRPEIENTAAPPQVAFGYRPEAYYDSTAPEITSGAGFVPLPQEAKQGIKVKKTICGFSRRASYTIAVLILLCLALGLGLGLRRRMINNEPPPAFDTILSQQSDGI
ncbi:MAG: hypothetical protein Q9167_003600 [Letrouitia subvulpina]